MNLTAPNQLPGQSQRRVSEPAWTVRRISRPQPAAQPKARVTRRFDIEWLEDGQTRFETKVAPALPVYEQAFGAFTHGVLIHTTEGPVAVEDLVPGMHVECADGRASQLLWKGSINLVPGAPTLNDGPDHIYRVMPDAFGLARPAQDQTFGPHARRVDRNPKLRATLGTESALIPLSAMVDGNGVIEVTPVAPTRVYHLACASHETVLAAGLEVETYHPGPETPLSLPEEMLLQFMTFFPHLGAFRDFGKLAAPRLKADELLAML